MRLYTASEAFLSFTEDGLRIKRPFDRGWFDPRKEDDRSLLLNSVTPTKEAYWIIEFRRTFVIESPAVPLPTKNASDWDLAMSCQCELVARNAKEAVTAAVKHPDMADWVRYSRSINKPPFSGLVAHEKIEPKPRGLWARIRSLWKTD